MMSCDGDVYNFFGVGGAGQPTGEETMAGASAGSVGGGGTGSLDMTGGLAAVSSSPTIVAGGDGGDALTINASSSSYSSSSTVPLLSMSSSSLEAFASSLNIKTEDDIMFGSTVPTLTMTGTPNYGNINIGCGNSDNNFNIGQQAAAAGISGFRIGSRRKAEWTDDSSEYNYAKALIDQASSMGTSSDLDRSSVLRLAQVYINLQQGLQSWEHAGHRLELWPPFINTSKLTLTSQHSLGCFVLIVTGHGTVVYVSDAIETLLGHEQINLVGRSIQNLIHPEEMSVLATQFSLVTGAGQVPSSRSFYTRMLNAGKSKASRQVFDLVHVTGHLQEVALASSSDRAMGQKETWLMCACKVMAHVPEKEGPCSPYVEWVSHNELNGKIIDIDARSSQVTGYLPSEMVGLSPYCFIHSDDQEHVAFFHNQALFDAEGASTYYRMYTSSHEIVFVHTTMQLSSDKLTNRPKSLFCIHRVVSEKEGLDQILQHQQLVIWSKPDPSSKFSMADIEHMVSALEERGVASRNIPSKGGMMNSRLTDSCTLDGADLLNRNLSQFLSVPPSFTELTSMDDAMSLGIRQSSRGGHSRLPYSRMNSPYHHRSQQQRQQQQLQQQLHQQQQLQQHQHQNLYSPISPIGSVGSSSSIGGDVWSGKSQQQRSQIGYRHHSLNQQHSSLSPPQSRPAYQHQLSLSSTSPISTGGSTPHPDSPVSFIDLLNESCGPPSVPPSDSKHMDMLSGASGLNPGVRGRGRGRSRGRPRGSGRGTRGMTRGVGRPRGTRGGRGRGRGRGSTNPTANFQGAMGIGGMQKMNVTVGHGSLSPGRGRPQQGMHMHHNLGTDMSPDLTCQMMPTSCMSQGNMATQARVSPFHSMITEDDSLLKNTMADFDFLDTKSNIELQPNPSMQLMSPLSLSSQDSVPNMQISPCQSFNEATNIKDTGQHDYRKPGAGVSAMHRPGGGISYYQETKNKPNYDMLSMGNSSQSGMTSAGLPRIRKRELQHSLSMQGPTETQEGPEPDVEHSILGNLLKGRGGSNSTSSSKSPIHSFGFDKGMVASPSQTLPSHRWSPAESMGGGVGGVSAMKKSKWIVNPVSADREGTSLSEASSPASVFSPDPSMSITMSPKGGRSPHASSQGMANMIHHPGLMAQKAAPLQCDTMTSPGDIGMLKEIQLFSTQLRQKHKTLEQDLSFQDKVLRHLESNIQQPPYSEIDPESFYARLNARLDNIKANKVKQEQELRTIQAKLESKVKDCSVEQQQQQQQPQQPQPPPLPPAQLPLLSLPQLSSNTQTLQASVPLQQPSLVLPSQFQQTNPVEGQTRLRLTSPALASHRRMAIVPPIQRQIPEEESTGMAQSTTADLKSSSDLVDLQCNNDSLRLESISPTLGSKGSAVDTSKTKNQQRHLSPVATSLDTSSTKAMANQVSNDQYSLHHHHHHHHHYHHQIPIQSQPTKQSLEMPRAGKVTPPPPPPYDHADLFPPVSTAAVTSAATSISRTALNISVPSLSASLMSPVVCDTSPISVDESPSCASDTSSGYHSLSLSADTGGVSAAGSFQKPHDGGSSVVSGLLYQSKTPPTSTFHSKLGMSSELLTGAGDFNPSASI